MALTPAEAPGHDGPWISVLNLWAEALPRGNLPSLPTLSTVVEAARWMLEHTSLPVSCCQGALSLAHRKHLLSLEHLQPENQVSLLIDSIVD